MQVLQNYPLKRFNSFGIDILAKSFAPFADVETLQELLKKPGQDRLLVLGGGSNILFTSDFDGLVLKNEIKGIKVTGEDEDHIHVTAGAGENWHQFVSYCIEHNYAGLENLSLIPGCVGASPIQNIGAYGVELKDVFEELVALRIADGQLYRFKNSECAFGYRDSIFKRKYKNKFIILQVTFRLNRKPVFNTSYGAIEEELKKIGTTEPSIKAVSQAVINIRKSKLPDPEVIGNAGSFFKNPQVTAENYISLKKEYPGLVGYPMPDGTVKLAAGWLIEQCAWKGYRKGDAGCHKQQALVLVNYGNAKGAEIFQLSEEIMLSVKQKFGVRLEREVNII